MPAPDTVLDAATVTPDDDGDPTDRTMGEKFYASGRVSPGDESPEWKAHREAGGGDKPPVKAEKPPEETETTDPEKASEEEPEAKADPKPGFWDKDRQQRDQANANERREMKGQIDTLTTLVGTLQAQSTTKAETEQADATADKVEDLMKIIEDPDVTGPQIAKVMRELRAIDGARAKTSEPSSELGEVLKSIKALGDRMDANDARTEAAESSTMLNEMLDGFDKQYDPKYRNDAYESARKQLEAQGFGQDNLPHPEHVRLLLGNAYREAWDTDPKNKDKKPRPKLTTPVDTGKGGNAIPLRGPDGDNDQVFADIRKRGEFG